MNSSGYHEMKKFPKEDDTQLNEKIRAHDRLESTRVPFGQGSRKGRKFNAGYYIAEILEPLSQWRSIEAAGNKRKLLVHADNARPHTTKLSTQYFNENRMKSAPHPPYSIFHTPLISRRRTFLSSDMTRDVSQTSHSRMKISFLQQ
jgi:hypothetical protein